MPIRLNVVLCFYMRCRFSRAYLVGRARVLVTTCLPPLLPAACEHVRASPTAMRTRGISALWCHGTDVSGVSLAAVNGAVWPGAKSTRLGGVNIFSYVN